MDRTPRSRREFLVSLAGSVVIHAGAFALLLAVVLPRVETPRPFQVEILPPQPLPPAPPEAAPAPPKLAPMQRLKRLLAPESRQVAPAPPQAAAPEPPLAITRSEPADSARVPAPEPAAPPRKADAAPAPPFTPPSVNADYLRNPAPRYPAASRRNGEQGTVLLKVLISRDGAPLKVELEKSSGWPNLDRAAVEAVHGWRFVPARRGNEAVEAPYLVPVVFRLEGG